MYAELHCKTNYSFLTGASHADELVQRAIELDYTALAVTDENTLAGVVRAFAAARETKLKLIIGAEIILNDAPPVVLWAPDRRAYANLSKLLTVGRRRAPKGECWLCFDDVVQHSAGLLAGVIPYIKGDRSRTAHIDQTHPSYEWFRRVSCSHAPNNHSAFPIPHSTFKDLFDDRAYLLAELYQGVDDNWRIEQLQQLSQRSGLPLVAAGDVLYHSPARLPLHDVLTATQHKTTVAEAGDLLIPNAQRHLQTIEQRAAAFKKIPDAINRTTEIADRCSFCLSQLRYEYPIELAPDGQTPIEYLREMTAIGAADRYPDGVPAKVQNQINHELKLIDEMRYEAFFLTVWDAVRFARSRGILCQGRGSAANSAVCYALGITSVDPATTDLLFERFISKERNEAPDIDVDFEHERREEVLQYLYTKYGRDRAGLAATVITYRVRSAVRDVGKALGLSLDRVDALAKHVEGYSKDENLSSRMQDVGIDPETRVGQQLNHLVNEIIGFPRHLSQHVGGMVITQGKLDELVPIENAAMEERTVIQWDKNDLEELGLLKVDCLCLGMLSAIKKCFTMLDQHWGRPMTLATVPKEDPKVYDMICAADTVGVFQIESRGQMSMLPRLKPRCWYDLVIEVAIVRPGPIQGNMVHPFLRRRNGEEPVVYPNEEIKAVLHRTLGVPIFQEQAMKLAVVAAGFTPGEADQLRRAMGAWRKTGVIEKFQEKLMTGMRERGLSDEFAEQVFRQIRGFGEYGFPESHAASFAKLVYVSSWLKHYYPAAFCAALINSQPMGFYAPAQLVSDAREHGVEVLPVDVNLSDWDCSIEDGIERSEVKAPAETHSRNVSGKALAAGNSDAGHPQQNPRLLPCGSQNTSPKRKRQSGPLSPKGEHQHQELCPLSPEGERVRVRGPEQPTTPESNTTENSSTSKSNATETNSSPTPLIRPSATFSPQREKEHTLHSGDLSSAQELSPLSPKGEHQHQQLSPLSPEGERVRVRGPEAPTTSESNATEYSSSSPSDSNATETDSSPTPLIRPTATFSPQREKEHALLSDDLSSAQEPCPLPLRLGLRMISGLRSTHAQTIMLARRDGPFTSVSDFTRRTRLGSAIVTLLSKADAFGSLDQDRREALWQALAQEKKPLEQPLFDTLDADDDLISSLPTMTLQQQVVEDYRSVGLSLKAHPMSFYREQLNEMKITPTGELENGRNNQFIRVAGLVTLRQRPSTAKGITFVTLEDETGTANLVVFQNIWERHYKIARTSPAWIAYGKLEMKSNVIHVVVSKLEDMSDQLEDHGIKSRDFR